MTIVVGYAPAPEGVAALDFAAGHAKLTGAHQTLLNQIRRPDQGLSATDSVLGIAETG